MTNSKHRPENVVRSGGQDSSDPVMLSLKADNITEADVADTLAKHGGWTFDPTREVWWAKIGPSTWTEVKGALDNPPSWSLRRMA